MRYETFDVVLSSGNVCKVTNITPEVGIDITEEELHEREQNFARTWMEIAYKQCMKFIDEGKEQEAERFWTDTIQGCPPPWLSEKQTAVR